MNIQQSGRGINLVLIFLLAGCQAATLTAAPISTQPEPTTPAPATPETVDGAPMVYVPAGEFIMGSSLLNEQPVHTVRLDAFWIDTYEVTNAHYKQCVDAGACRPPASTGSNEYETYFGDPSYDNYPINQIDWADATQYCAWAGEHLPTEAQWEKAARGTDGRTYPWGNTWDPAFAHSTLDGYLDTAEVGSKPGGASPYGAMDMAGNVWEWTADWYSEDYYAAPPVDNPPGPQTGKARVLRGGGYGGYDAGMRATVRRGDITPLERQTFIGFRCAK